MAQDRLLLLLCWDLRVQRILVLPRPHAEEQERDHGSQVGISVRPGSGLPERIESNEIQNGHYKDCAWLRVLDLYSTTRGEGTRLYDPPHGRARELSRPWSI